VPYALISDIRGAAAGLEAVPGELREWTLARLEPRRLEQIRSFHATDGRDGPLAFHGSPGSYDGVLLPETEDDAAWRIEGYAVLAGGHIHTRWARRIGDALYVNPGALTVREYAGVSVEFRRCVS
jgi:hypothetical protein